MGLTNYGDILALAKKRCRVDDITDFDDIIGSAINSAYIELKQKYPLVATAAVSSVNKIVTLPSDCMDIISIDPVLYADEYRLGDNLILQQDNTYTIVYSKVPAALTNTTDVPLLNKKFWYALSTYGCYAYYNFKKKHNEAAAYMQEYLSIINKVEEGDMLQHEVQNVYSSVLSEVGTWPGF